MKTFKKQVIRILDAKFASTKVPTRPKEGWLKEIRTAMGMPERVLGKKLGLDRSTIAKLQKAERDRSITLSSLDKVADALQCDVKYVLVPRKPLKEMVYKQALEAARRTLGYVEKTMKLEDQGVQPGTTEEQVEDLAQELLFKGDMSIWEEGN